MKKLMGMLIGVLVFANALFGFSPSVSAMGGCNGCFYGNVYWHCVHRDHNYWFGWADGIDDGGKYQNDEYHSPVGCAVGDEVISAPVINLPGD